MEIIEGKVNESMVFKALSVSSQEHNTTELLTVVFLENNSGNELVKEI